MTAKEYLRRYLTADAEINARLADIARLRALAERTTRAVRPAVAGGPKPDRLSSIIARIVDMEREVDEAIDQLQNTKSEVEAAIDAVEDPALRTLLRYRYICGWTWEKIAVEMGYTYRHVTRMHGQALAKIGEHMPA